MASLGSFSVDIRAGTATLQSDLGKAHLLMERQAKRMQEIATKAGQAIGAGFAAGAAASAALVRQSINAADQLDEMSQKLGVAASQLSGLGLAAQRGGVNLDVLAGGLVRLARGASDTAQGVGTARDAFAALGISVTQADGSLKSSDTLLKEVAGEFARFEDGAEKTALAVRLFGKSGADLIPTLNLGAQGIAELQERAQAFGLVIADDVAAQAGQFNDNMDDLRNLVTGFGNDLTATLLPSLVALSGQFVDSGLKAREGSNSVEVLAGSMKGLIAGAIIAKNTVEGLVNAIAGAVDTASAAATAARKLGQWSSPVSVLSGMATGTLEDPGTIMQEFEQRAVASSQAAATGIGDSIADIKEALAALDTPARDAAAAIESQGAAALVTAPALVSLAKAETDAAAAAKEQEKALKALDKEWSDYASILDDVKRDHAEVSKAYARQQAQFDAQAKDIQNEINLLGVAGEARERMAIAIEAERLARDQNGNLIEEERKRLEGLLSTLNEAAKLDALVMEFDVSGFDELLRKIDELNAGLEKVSGQSLVDLRESLGNARQEAFLFATEAVGRGISSLQSMAEEGTSAYRKLEVAQAALNLVTAIGAIATQGLGDPYTAFARIAAMIAAMQQLGLAVSGSGGPSSQSAEVRQEQQGTGTVLGDSMAKSESILNAMEITADATSELVGINRGMLRALQTLESGIGSATGMIARGGWTPEVGNLDSGGLLGLPSLGLSNAIFGGRQELIDQGIVIMGGALSDLINQITVGAYNTIETDGGWFSSDDVDTNVTDITDQFGEQFQMIMESIANTVREGALALGILPAEIESAIAQFRVEEIRISLKDLSAEEQQAELQAVFSSIFDGLAESVVPWVEQFQQLGEGLGETLVRVATSVQVTQEAMLQLGFSLDQTDPELFAQIAVGLIELTGGIDEFISGMQSFVSNFAPEAHKFEVAQDAITRAFAQFGLEVPATRDGMWALMQSLDATTEQGREQIAMLLELAGVSDAYYSMLEDSAEDAARAAREAAEAEAELAQARLDAMRAYADTVTGINRSLYELSGATEFRQSLAGIQEQYMANVATLQEQARAAGLASARSEDLAAAMLLQARQVALLVRELEASARTQADALGLTPLAVLGSEIEALQAREEAAAAATARLAESFRRVGQISSDVASAMLGEFGPLAGQAKAEFALRALQSGAIGLDAALNAGRDVFASGADFNRFFEQAVGIAQRRTDGEQDAGGAGGGSYVSPAMRELLKQQAELQAQAARATELIQAQELAQTIADLSSVRGEDFQTVIDSLGIDLEAFLKQLGFESDTQLGELITQMQEEQASLELWLSQNVTADGLAIVAALHDIAGRTDDPLLNPPVQPIPVEAGGIGKSARDETREDASALRQEIADLRDEVSRLLRQRNEQGQRTTRAVEEGVRIANRDWSVNEATRPRSVRRVERVVP